MNQILITENTKRLYSNLTIENKKKKKSFFIIFIISISICIIILFYLLFSLFSKIKEKNKTFQLKNKYNISTLYNNNNNNNNYNAIKLSNDISIIGLIEIPKINISYPILENSNKELLKISVCRFSGPFPNRVGNLCIAGHNYKNNMMFSNLNKLNINDSVFITDLHNTKLEYIIYNKFKVKENNLECIQNTTNTEITLITCNTNNNSERIVVKAKVKG